MTLEIQTKFNEGDIVRNPPVVGSGKIIKVALDKGHGYYVRYLIEHENETRTWEPEAGLSLIKAYVPEVSHDSVSVPNEDSVGVGA